MKKRKKENFIVDFLTGGVVPVELFSAILSYLFPVLPSSFLGAIRVFFVGSALLWLLILAFGPKRKAKSQ